jgi:8-oxo-dGTP pyrophosphatase MutT (NUDIX family)
MDNNYSLDGRIKELSFGSEKNIKNELHLDEKMQKNKSFAKYQLNKKKYKKRSQSIVSEPITSYGLILFSKNKISPSRYVLENTNSYIFLLYQRRDNFEYMDFLRGLWNSESQIIELFSLMSCDERDRIRNYTFQELWDDLWVVLDSRIYMEGFLKAKKKYDSIKSIIPDFLNTTESCVIYPPWGFPKGKKNGYNEDSLECALREFEEETKLSISTSVKIIQKTPLIETFKGSNGKIYSTHYFIAEIAEPLTPLTYDTPHCIRKTTISEEASDIKWFTLEESTDYLNPQRQEILLEALEIIKSSNNN